MDAKMRRLLLSVDFILVAFFGIFADVFSADDRSLVQLVNDRAVPAVFEKKKTDEERLLSLLFTNYNQFARPVCNSSNTVTVAIQFSLMHIKDLDIRSQILTTTGLLILEWTDERLTWEPVEHNGMTEMIIEARALWKPEFAVINGAEKIYEEYNQFRAVVSHRGLVHWEPGGVFKTMCDIDIRYYPFDEQHCQLTFGAWSYHTGKMNLTTYTHSINLDSYKKNGEWEILDTRANRNEFAYECCPREKFSNVAFTILLRRRHMFYVMNIIMPSIMTSILLLSIFFCTPAQKVQIGVVVLLSFRIFLLNAAGNIPKTSDHVPLLVIYLTSTLAITTMSMVLTVLVLNLHGISDRPVPIWVRSLVLVVLARCLGMCDTAAEARQRSRSNREQHPLIGSKNRRENMRTTSFFFFRESPPLTNTDLTAKLKMGQPPAVRPVGDEAGDPDEESLSDSGHQSKSSNINTPSRRPLVRSDKIDSSKDLLNVGVVSERKSLPPVDFAKDWKRVAEIFDRLFFWLFLLAVIISTLGLFHPLLRVSNH